MIFEELKQYLKQLSKTKIDAICVDWDGGSNDWHYYDLVKKEEKRKEAEKVVHLARYVFDNFVGQIYGELQLSTPEEIVNGLIEGKMHAMCNDCAYVITTIAQLNTHRTMKPDHQLGWYKNE